MLNQATNITLLSPPDTRNAYELIVFKQALVRQVGSGEGFERYRPTLGTGAASVEVRPLRSSYDFARKHALVFRQTFLGGQTFAIALPCVVGAGTLLEQIEIDVTVFTGPIVRPNNAEGYPTFGFQNFADYEIDEREFERFLGDGS